MWPNDPPAHAAGSPRLSPEDLDLIQRETLQATLQGATRTAVYNLAAAMLLAGMALSAARSPGLAAVLLGMGLVVSVWRSSLKRRFLGGHAPSRFELERAWRELQLNAMVSALMWAVASHFLLPRLPAALGVFYMLLLGCALATAAAFMTATPRALPAYVVFQLLALATAPLPIPAPHHLTVLLVLGFTVATLWMTSRQVRAATTGLARKLARANAARRLRQGRARTRQLREVARLERARRLAAESRTHFIARVSHDFRTPLQVISASCELIQLRTANASADERIQEPVERMQRACELLLARAAELSDWRRWESGAIPVSVQPVELAPVLQDIVSAIRPRAQTKGLFVRAEVPERGTVVLCDPARTRAIVSALLANAVRWTNHGGAWIEVDTAAARELVVRVRDSGPGLPQAVREALAREVSDGDLDLREDGMGVGLVTARMLCQQVGARLVHADLPQGGTEFSLFLPCQQADTAPAPPASS